MFSDAESITIYPDQIVVYRGSSADISEMFSTYTADRENYRAVYAAMKGKSGVVAFHPDCIRVQFVPHFIGWQVSLVSWPYQTIEA